MQLSGNKILITGGASGIGLAMAERFLREENTVIICGRRHEVLQAAQAQFPALIIKSCDLADATERMNFFQWIQQEHADVNVLVNNAGIQQWMDPDDPQFLEKALAEIAINIEAPIHLTKLFLQLPALHTIMNVTSGLSMVPLVKVPVYSATKAFMHSFNWSLRHLLRNKKVEVIEIVPPALNTDLGGKGIHDFAPPVAPFIEDIFNQLKEGKQTLTHGFTENMAKAGAEILQPVFTRMNGE